MIDPMCISTARILWHATRKDDMLLVIENDLVNVDMAWFILTWLIVDNDISCSGL
jgi:hypothetical protein